VPTERKSSPTPPTPVVPETPAPAEPPRDRSLRLEIFLAAALGLAAIVTAWASFRSALVEDEMIVNFNQGIKAVDEAGQAHSEAQQILVQDQALYLEFAKAAEQGDEKLAVYIYTALMNPNMQKAMDWWNEDPDAETPFDETSPYELPARDRYEELNVQAEERFDAAAVADEQTDRYDFVTVLAAIVLFFLGLASVVRHRTIRLIFVVMGTVILATSLAALARIGLT
jgi:hypothetical protein